MMPASLRAAQTIGAGTARSAKSRSRFYRPELDVLRFFAFLLVFESHAFEHVPTLNLHSGGYGVDLFFALSSYLITTLLLKEHAETGAINAGKFYFRRGLRIWPLYFFFLLVLIPLAHYTIGDRLDRYELAMFLVASGNWACVVWGWPASIAAPLWSVSVEEQFYLVWPFAMKRFLHRLPAAAIALLVIANITRVCLALAGAGNTATWCNTFARLDPIALGALLAWYLDGRIPELGYTLRSGLIAFGLGSFLFAGLIGAGSGWKSLWRYPLVAVAAVAILCGFLGMNVQWPKGLVYLGKISYGLYVFHVGALTLLAHYFPLDPIPALALTVFAAAVSYRFLELPFLRLKERFTVVRSRPA
ncbi:MAG: acyltransferase family protein [Bryobacteraceae bacterium]